MSNSKIFLFEQEIMRFSSDFEGQKKTILDNFEYTNIILLFGKKKKVRNTEAT